MKKLKGGYNVKLGGRPASRVEVLPEPEVLYLPRASRRFTFSETCVEEGERVAPGHVLARDPSSYSTPLLAPRAGTVRLEAVAGHITLEDVEKVPEEPYHPDEDLLHIPKNLGSAGIKRYKLVCLGAWSFFRDARTGALPDPFGAPNAVIVSTLRMEPFVARGDVQIHKRLSTFTKGLEHLQSLLEYESIYLVVPQIESEFGARVRERVRGYARVKVVQIPLRYGLGDFHVLARHLGPETGSGKVVWGLDVAGVLALDRALTLERPCTVSIISLGGPGVVSPTHLKAMPGYPLRELLRERTRGENLRVLNGGALTGRIVEEDQLGLDVECEGLTVLPEHEGREFLGFMRPGRDRRSFSNCFLSALGGVSGRGLTTALGGEPRPCVSCGFCDEVCPAGIMPQLIHKLLYQDALEEAEKARTDLCVQCGLCSYVCPSKIELREELIAAKKRIKEELYAGESHA